MNKLQPGDSQRNRGWMKFFPSMIFHDKSHSALIKIKIKLHHFDKSCLVFNLDFLIYKTLGQILRKVVRNDVRNQQKNLPER